MLVVDKQRIVDDFIELVRIDSVSRRERIMVDKLMEKLIPFNWEVYEDNAASGISGNAGNIILKVPGKKDWPVLLLNAHLDRAEPGRGIKPAIKNGYLFSKGDTILAGDDIAGVVTILEILRQIKKSPGEHIGLKIVFTVAEEAGLLGAKNLDFSQFSEVDYGLVFDGDGEIGSIINRAPGQIKLNAVINGGNDNIKITTSIISKINLGKIDKDTTASMKVVRGKNKDKIELEGEIRSFSRERLCTEKVRMERIIEQVVNRYQAEVRIESELLYPEYDINPENKFLQSLKKGAEKMDLTPCLIAGSSGSDANILNRMGITAVNLGLGLKNVHSKNEKIKINDLVKLIRFTLSAMNEIEDFYYV